MKRFGMVLVAAGRRLESYRPDHFSQTMLRNSGYQHMRRFEKSSAMVRNLKSKT